MCTSVASRVHGTTGLPCSSEPWWLRMMCSTRLRELGREAVEPLDRAAHAVVAERDLAVQAAVVGHRDRAALELVRLELADVVQQRAGDRDVAVDARERRRDRADRLGDRQRVLEQAVAVGLVVALGRRRVAVARPGRRSLAEDRRQQPPQVRVLDRREQLAQVGLHLRRRRARAVEQLVAGVLAVARAAQRAAP